MQARIIDRKYERVTGLITHSYDFISGWCSTGCKYQIDFPRESSPQDKLIIINSAVILD